jgi:hypothetical protein
VRPALLVLALLVLPGCAAPARHEAPPPQLWLVGLDGRWPVPKASLTGLLTDASWPRPAGAALFGGGVATMGGRSAALDFAALDEGAARAVDPNGTLDPPAPGEVALEEGWAREHGLGVGDALRLRVSAFPRPLVTAAYEMERIRACGKLDAPICFAPGASNQTTLRIAVPPDSRDLGLLPEGVELGPNALPAWWNGTIDGPGGEHLDFHAALDAQGHVTPGQIAGPVAPGNWTVAFRLESARAAINGGAAGIVRLREPGYGWFDDRLAADPEGANQTRTLLSWGEDHALDLRVARLVDRPIPAAEALLSPADARALLGARPGEATALVVNASITGLAALSDARNATSDAAAAATRARPLPDGPGPADPQGGALLFRAPLDVDLAGLPRVAGAGTPSLAVALETPVGENASVEGRGIPALRVLAFGGPGAPPFRMPADARWPTTQAALENVTRSRTLVLATPDWSPGGIQASRLVLGDSRVGRVTVAVTSVEGGPAAVAWASPSLIAGAGKPLGAVVLLPLLPGADAGEVAARAQAAWGARGLAIDEP